MAEITPEDVAKGMLKHLTEQSNSVIISREDFLKICKKVAEESTEAEKSKMPDPLIMMMLMITRMEFMYKIANELFGKKKEEEE